MDGFKGGDAMSFLTLEDVVFTYQNGHTAIEGVSLAIEKGESVAIIGQNGAGKTTLVKLMNGLLKPTQGDVIVDGWNTKAYTTAQISRKVGYVFQNPDDQIFHSNVYSEVEFGPKNLRLSTEQVKANVMKAVLLTRMEPYVKENPQNLPYSMRKFVSIASVLAMDTDVIILDEPTAGQDRIGMQILSEMLEALKAEGKTLITITHDMEFAVGNFDRMIVMAHQKKLADTDKREIFWNHAILDVAMLKQPYISRLCRSLGFNQHILNISEMVDYLDEQNRR